jgi:hypothetical protein
MEDPCSLKSANKFVVLAMRADPEPVHAVGNGQSERTVVPTYSDYVKTAVAHGLELQRSVRRVGLEQRVASVSKVLHISGSASRLYQKRFDVVCFKARDQSSRDEPD